MDEKEAGKLIRRGYFSKVEAAREALRNRSFELIKLQMRIIKLAIKKGDLETAAEANQFLLDHVPSGDTGVRVLEVSVDKKTQEVAVNSQPSIQIGFNLGGLLPAGKPTPAPEQPIVIDVTPIEEPKKQ